MTPAELGRIDVLVIGAGNAAANAALSAHEAGASVAMIETAPKEARGGNSAFTGGAFRFKYSSVQDLLQLAPDIADLDLATIDFGSYTENQYFDDMGRLTEYRCDPELTEVLIGNSYAAALWLRRQGVRFQPALGRQAFKVDGKFKFWGGLACHILGGGQHLVTTLHDRLEHVGIPVLYDTTATALLRGDERVDGVRVRHRFRQYDLRAGAVVMACGGFESNAEMRARYLGPELGSRESARHEIQQRYRPPHGNRHRRRGCRPLVGCARRTVGHERAALWRPDGGRSVPEAQLSIRRAGERARRTLPGRGAGLPQLHLCPLWA